jgi:hypothetical protein
VDAGSPCCSPRLRKAITKPHPGRPRAVKQFSMYTTLVRQVMAQTGTSLEDLAAAAGREVRSLYHSVNDSARPMSPVTAQRLLAAMGHGMQVEVRAVPLSAPPAGVLRTELVSLEGLRLADLRVEDDELLQAALREARGQVIRQIIRPRANLGGAGPPGRVD